MSRAHTRPLVHAVAEVGPQVGRCAAAVGAAAATASVLAICPVFCPEACARPPARKQLMHIHDVPEAGLLYSVPCRMACSNVFRAVRDLRFPRTDITCELCRSLLSNNNTPRAAKFGVCLAHVRCGERAAAQWARHAHEWGSQRG